MVCQKKEKDMQTAAQEGLQSRSYYLLAAQEGITTSHLQMITILEYIANRWSS